MREERREESSKGEKGEEKRAAVERREQQRSNTRRSSSSRGGSRRGSTRAAAALNFLKFKVLNPCLTLAPKVGMAVKMKKAREKLNTISNDRHNFCFTAVPQVIDERETSSRVIEADIQGRGQEIRKVIALLTEANTSSEFIILPIYGIGGIGKTTFAQLLFNDTHFKYYKKAWVYVSQTFDLKKIDDSITSQLQKEQGQLIDTQEPDADVPASKKILIVLDDLWENDDFKLEALKISLKLIGSGGCKVFVIATTRDADIAQKIQTTEAYKIEPLSTDMCWTIIKQIVGFDGRSDKETLKDTGKEIAKKCAGVALAARALGYMLRFRNFNGWVSVKDSGIWNVSTSGYTTSPYDNVLASLKLSYSSMLPYLRLCFAYCAIFPKGHKMAKDDLIYQWVALGFINPSDDVSSWQHGGNCIEQLLGMSFFQHSKSPSSDRKHDEDVTLFTMHDLVHDLARLVMGNELLDASTKCNIGGSNCRYAVLADCSKPLNLFVSYPDKIRALRFLGSGEIGRYAAGFSTAKYLRVLDLGECSIQKLPSSICQLKQLRYLNAPGIKDRMIPSCITKLSKLIYLNLRGSSAILALPKSIGEMEGLTYLDLSGCSEIRELPESIGEMEGLTYLDLSGCSKISELPESFRKLKNLVHLDFSNCSVICVSKSLGSLTQLQYLNLSDWRNIIVEEPEALGSLTELRYLNLSRSSYFLPRSDCDVLGTLTNLEYLNLSSGEEESLDLKRLPEALGSFTELKYLNLSGCELLDELPGSFGNLRNLVHLDLSDCYHVNGIPEALRSLTKLRYLNLSRKRKYSGSSLGGLPEVIGKLIELRYLNLSGCLDRICPRLEIIVDFSYLVDSLLDSISTLSNLEHLELSNNSILGSIPGSFCSLRKLHTLDLTGCCQLRRLPANIGDMDSLKSIIAVGCSCLHKSALPNKRSLISFPYFVVHNTDGEQSSNLVLLKDVTCPELEISRLENVKSVEEARRIELREKQSMVKLTLDWTREKKGSVEDMELLRELVPPRSLKQFMIRGYNSVSFPTWLMDIATYLPYLVEVKLTGLSQCSSLPPLGQLPNLKYLDLEAMPSITKIDSGFCGGVKAFAQLERLSISNMESLDEWSVTYSYAGIVSDEFMFPNLWNLTIRGCRKLRLNPCPPIVKGTWCIIDSDGVLLQWGDSSPHTGSSTSSALVACLSVKSCMAPMHQWKLLHHLPALDELIIEDCNDLSSSSEIVGDLTSLRTLTIRECPKLNNLPESMQHLSCLQSQCLSGCQGIQALPERLGDLVSLKTLEIIDCNGIVSLPESIQQLTTLEELRIFYCPALEQWCKLEENKMKIGHIKKIEINGIRQIPMNVRLHMRLQK
ncbi:putative disease resistance protein RGA1 isoform X2 [Phragmites australis]|uniref:putative disease resistance protein RGA1 isoform X2 n=1 Tax=Phragmites australis TaxID=29695 RepID=UPI002D78B1E6|nr:putative disease resistance protein RGA1 isoform X2 [Phragmites australis]